MLRSPERTARYLGIIADFPLSVVVDHDGSEWTWCEGRSFAVAIRGRVDGLGAVPVWDSPPDWRGTMRLAWSPPRKSYSRVYQRDPLVQWAGPAWWPPEDPCPHCHGTGRAGGRPADLARVGALRPGVLLDRALLARIAPLLDPGAIVIDAKPDTESDAIRIRSVAGGARAVLARMRGHTDGLETFEAWFEARTTSGALAGLSDPVAPFGDVGGDTGARTLLGPSWSPSDADLDPGLEPDPAPAAAPRKRPAPIDGPGDLHCARCGGVVRAGQCRKCGHIP